MAAQDQIIRSFDGPRCARELSEHLGLSRKAVESALARLTHRGVVACVTPALRQSRLYDLTPIGRAWKASVTGTRPSALESPPPLELYAWVQAGSHRRAALRHLTGTMTAVELRPRLSPANPGMAMCHVWAVLREFRTKGLAESDRGRWRLTDVGRELQAHLLDGQSNGH